MDLKERETFIKSKPEFFFENINKNFVLLNTCLRLEFYYEGEIPKEFLENKNFYHKTGKEAILYLFRVVCGLDSIILGEEQILSQIKKSYVLSLEKLRTNSSLNAIFNNAISLGKRFRFESKINSQSLSLESIAFKFIKAHFPDYLDKNFFILGIGDLSRDLLKIFQKEGIKKLSITNRTFHKIKEIEYDYDIEAVDFKKKYEKIKESDIIITSTSAPHLIIEKKKLLEHIDDESEKCFIDLAVPRDIEEGISNLKNINLYNLDDLWEVYNENSEKRNKISKEYFYLLNEQFEKIVKWFFYKNKNDKKS